MNSRNWTQCTESSTNTKKQPISQGNRRKIRMMVLHLEQPSTGFQRQNLCDERVIQRWLPMWNQQMFKRPGFGISIKRFQHKDSEHFKIRASGPVLEGELCAHWHFVTNLTEFRHAVKFTLWSADGRRPNIEPTMLMVNPRRFRGRFLKWHLLGWAGLLYLDGTVVSA